MENDCIDTLEHLFEIKREKKGKEPSKSERKQFCDIWVKLAVSEGYSERAEQYLYDGVSYCAAKPFKEYLARIENQEQGLQSFFAGKMYRTNTKTAFCLQTHLLALLLNDKKSVHLLPVVITNFSHTYFNKDKKRLGNIKSIMLKYFFEELNPKVHLVPLSEIDIKEQASIVDFISVVESTLEEIDPNGLSQKRVANITKVKQWIDEYRQSKGSQTVSPLSINNSAEAVAPVVPMSTEPMTSGEPPVDVAAYLIDLLNKADKAAVAVKSEYVQQKRKIDILTQELKEEQKKLQCTIHQIADQQMTIDELREELSAAKGDILILRQNIAQKDSIIAEKDAEIAERIKVTEILSRDKNKQADEWLQRFASRIRVEYRDFVDALDVPMSCDLGDNLKLQLQSIFDILEKGGMKLK